jgi:hypothetical protein
MPTFPFLRFNKICGKAMRGEKRLTGANLFSTMTTETKPKRKKQNKNKT